MKFEMIVGSRTVGDDVLIPNLISLVTLPNLPTQSSPPCHVKRQHVNFETISLATGLLRREAKSR